MSGRKNGKGLYNFANLDVYDGQFVNGLRQGQGKYVWNDGSFYDGILLIPPINRRMGLG